MKSILINSETQEVKEVTLENVLTDSYNAIGNECGMVQIGEYINDCGYVVGYYIPDNCIKVFEGGKNE